jgi:ABC-2 type transport system permease protein
MLGPSLWTAAVFAAFSRGWKPFSMSLRSVGKRPKTAAVQSEPVHDMSLYITLWRIGLQDAIQYRLEGIIWFLFDVVPPIMMLFFWNAAYADTDQVAGYSLPEMLAYTLGVLVLRNLVTVHVEWDIDYEVRQGTLSNYLVRPISPWIVWFVNQLSWRMWRTALVCPILAIALITVAPSLELPSMDSTQVWGFLVSLLLAYLVCFLFKLVLGFTAFWLTNIQAVIGLSDVLVYLFGGILIPMQLLPEGLQQIALYLPLQSIFAFPLSVMLGRSQGADLIAGLTGQIVWCGLLGLLAVLMWRTGLRRYEAVGG